MRVLLINDYNRLGGCEVIVHLTADGLVSRGHEVELLVGEGRVTRSPLSYVDSRAGRRLVRERLSAFAPDVVHVHNMYHLLSPGVLAEIAAWRVTQDARVVMTAHDFQLVCPNPGLRYFDGDGPHRGPADRRLCFGELLWRRWDHRGRAHGLLRIAQHLRHYRWPDRRHVFDVILCPSRFMQSVLRVSELPATFLPNPAPAPQSAGSAGPKEFTMLFAGRLEPEKGLAPFLRALPAEWRGVFAIVGDGSERAACEEIVRERQLEDRVSFTGRLDRVDVMAAMEQSHVVVLPSLWYENAPVQLFEALACGARLLVSGFGGMKEIVDESGAGETFDPEDPASLGAALERLAGAVDGALRAPSAEVRAFLEERSEERYFERLVAIYAGDE